MTQTFPRANWLVLAATVCLSLLGGSCARQGWYRCHYRATVEANDGRLGVPCVAQAQQAEGPDRGRVFIETKTETGSPFHGWMRVVRPNEISAIRVHLVVSCAGYEDLSRDFSWTSTPDTCKPGVEVGEFRVHPGTSTIWPGSGPSAVQEKID